MSDNNDNYNDFFRPRSVIKTTNKSNISRMYDDNLELNEITFRGEEELKEMLVGDLLSKLTSAIDATENSANQDFFDQVKEIAHDIRKIKDLKLSEIILYADTVYKTKNDKRRFLNAVMFGHP